MLVQPFSVETFGLSQPAVDEVPILLRCADTSLRFLLESVQHVDRLREAHGIDGAPGVASVVRDDLNHKPSAKTFQRLCRRVGFTLLGRVEGLADIAPDLARKTPQVSPAGADPYQRAFRLRH